MYKLYRSKLDDESSWKLPVENINKGLQIFEDDLAKRNISFFSGGQWNHFSILKIQFKV